MSIGRKLARLGGVGPGGRPNLAVPDVTHDEAGARARDPSTSGPSGESVVRDDDRGDGRWDAFRDALRSKSSRDARRPSPVDVDEGMPLPGERVETELGPLHRIEARHALDERHGTIEIGAAARIRPDAIARFALDPSFAALDPRRFVFLDTETTGLAGGAGTVPFLVGVAYFDGDALRVERWLLRRFGEEAPILARLAELLADASALVTYNGKSFDWPLLRTRYVLHRMRTPALAAHLDLVHGARRLLAGRIGSVRLKDVERTLLGFEREGDVDGAEIPEIFQEFQRRGSHPEMHRVLHHHALDLLAMPAMLARFAAYFAEEERPVDVEDRLACARVASRGGHDETTRRFVASMVDDVEGDDAVEGALLSARLSRRAGDHASERASLERAVAQATDDVRRVHALVALSKHLEHRARDAEAALQRAREARAIEADPTLDHRIGRLERRIARERRD